MLLDHLILHLYNKNTEKMSSSSQCRLCLSNDLDNVFVFGSLGEKYNLQVKVWKLFSVMMTSEDVLPKCICLVCIPKIEMFHNFTLTVRASQQQIEHIYFERADHSQFTARSNSIHEPNLISGSSSQYIPSDSKNNILKSPSSLGSVNNNVNNIKSDLSNVEVILNESSSAENLYRSNNSNVMSEGLAVSSVKTTRSIPANKQEEEHGFECFLMSDKDTDPLMDGDELVNRIEHVDVKPSLTLDNVRSRKSSQNTSRSKMRRPKKAAVPKKKLKKMLHSNIPSDNSVETDMPSNSSTHRPKTKRKSKKYSESVEGEDLELSDNNDTAISEIDQRLSDVYDFTCKNCNVKFPTFAKLCRHSKDFHCEQAVVVCCGKSITNVQRLKHHLAKHLPTDDLRCPQCGVDCSSKIHLNLHILSHLPHSLRPFKCTKCHRGYCNNSSLKAHINSSHNNTYIEAKECICDECGKSLTSEKKLYNHKNYHHRDTSRVCPNCGKMCRTKGLLNLHLESHKTEIDLKCTECDRMFRTSTAKRHHYQRNHSTAEFMCDICGRIYRSRGDVQKHIFTQHTDKKPEKCKICNKRFKLRSVLRNHMNQHTGELPYPCPHCPKAFTCSGNRTKHKKRIHPDYKQIEMELSQLNSSQVV